MGSAVPAVRVKLGGEEHSLLFDFNAVCDAEEITGLNLLTDPINYRSGRVIRAMTWAAMRRSKPGITLQQVGDLMDGHIEEVLDAVLKAIMLHAGATQEELEEAGVATPGQPTADPR